MSGECFSFPASAALDCSVAPTAKRLLLILCASYEPSAEFPASMRALKDLSGISLQNIRAALSNLEEAEYLQLFCERKAGYHLGEWFGRFLEETELLQIPRSAYQRLMAERPTNAAISVFLYLCWSLASGREELSLQEIAEGAGISPASVCRCLNTLRSVNAVIVEHHTCRNGIHDRNHYRIG